MQLMRIKGEGLGWSFRLKSIFDSAAYSVPNAHYLGDFDESEPETCLRTETAVRAFPARVELGTRDCVYVATGQGFDSHLEMPTM